MLKQDELAFNKLIDSRRRVTVEGRCKKEVPVHETLNVVIISLVVLMKHKIFATQPYNEERKRFI
jgi:hypothetical protein